MNEQDRLFMQERSEQLARDMLDMIRFEVELATRTKPMLPPRKPRGE